MYAVIYCFKCRSILWRNSGICKSQYGNIFSCLARLIKDPPWSQKNQFHDILIAIYSYTAIMQTKLNSEFACRLQLWRRLRLANIDWLSVVKQLVNMIICKSTNLSPSILPLSLSPSLSLHKFI